MKRIKRIGFFTILIFLLIPVVNVFAEVVESPAPYNYENGLLDDDSIIKMNTFPTNWYDNDLLSKEAMGLSYQLVFNTFVHIKGYYASHSYGSSSGRIYFYDDDGNAFSQSLVFNSSNSGKYINLDYENVYKIIIGRYSASVTKNILEIDFFGSYDSSMIQIPDSDGDGIPDSEDEYPDDPNNGDQDGDGIPDSEDEYPDDPTNTPPPDSDGDGIPDSEDEYPDDPNNGDQDGDGIPDSEDEYPDDPTNTPPPETAEEVPEVLDLQIEATSEKVDLSWKKPPKYFEKATIYRKRIGTVTSFNIKDLNPFSPMTVHASEDYDPLFETNGTTFSDLSVNENEEYQYKVTNTFEGMESKGVTVQKKIPRPPIIDKDTSLPFGVGALIESGNNLLGLIGSFLLLALSFIFVPKLINLIKGSIREKGIKRDKFGNRIHFQSKDTKAYHEKSMREMKTSRASGREPREPRTGRG